MIKNVGGFDRTARITAGIIIGAAGIYYNSLWGLIGILPLLTGVFQYCPAYKPLKISTYKK